MTGRQRGRGETTLREKKLKMETAKRPERKKFRGSAKANMGRREIPGERALKGKNQTKKRVAANGGSINEGRRSFFLPLNQLPGGQFRGREPPHKRESSCAKYEERLQEMTVAIGGSGQHTPKDRLGRTRSAAGENPKKPRRKKPVPPRRLLRNAQSPYGCRPCTTHNKTKHVVKNTMGVVAAKKGREGKRWARDGWATNRGESPQDDFSAKKKKREKGKAFNLNTTLWHPIPRASRIAAHGGKAVKI